MSVRFRVASIVFASGLVVGLVGCDTPNLGTDKGKYSYAIGAQIGKNLKAQNIDLDNKAFSAAIKDVMEGKEPRMAEEDRVKALRSMSEAMQAKEKVAAEENLKKGTAFLEENKMKEGWKSTESGLQYKIVEEGKGKKPKADDTVEVHYRGKLIDGKEFDSSYSRNQPAQFPVKGVIPGWTEALQLMPVGSKFELVIPPQLAYGDRGNPSIPANSALIFEVELLNIIKK